MKTLKTWFISRSLYLPRTDALEGGEVPDADEAAVGGGEEEAVAGAEGEGGDGLGVAGEGGAYGGIGRSHELHLVTARAGDEGAVGGDGEGAAAVELLQRGHAPVVPLHGVGGGRRRRHCWR